MDGTVCWLPICFYWIILSPNFRRKLQSFSSVFRAAHCWARFDIVDADCADTLHYQGLYSQRFLFLEFFLELLFFLEKF